MDSVTSRRRFVQLLGISAVVGLAGCSGGGEDGDEDDDDGASSDDGTDDGGSDDAGGGDDGDTHDPGGDDQDGDDGDGQGGDGDDGQTGDSPRLRDVFAWEDSFVMEFEDPEGSGTWTFNGGNWRLDWTGDDGAVEMYQIENSTYIVEGQNCFRYEDEFGPGLDLFDPEEPADDTEEYVATGRTTIDGEEVYEFDVGDGRYYVSVATGYPVRFEGTEDQSVITFHSWGNTNPITPPEIECTEQ